MDVKLLDNFNLSASRYFRGTAIASCELQKKKIYISDKNTLLIVCRFRPNAFGDIQKHSLCPP
jgi:hypothetical protein